MNSRSFFIKITLGLVLLFGLTVGNKYIFAESWDQAEIIIDPITKKIYIINGFFQNTGFINTWTINNSWNNISNTWNNQINTWNIESNITWNTETTNHDTTEWNQDLSEYEQALDRIYNKGLTKYKDPNEYRPNDPLTREESAKIIWQLYSTLWYPQTIKNENCTFLDQDKFDPTLSEHIQKVCQRGLFKWANWNFMPRNQLSRPEAITVLIRMFEWKLSDETGKIRREKYFLKWRYMWIIDPDFTISNYEKSITRKEIAIYAYRLQKIANDEKLKNLSLNAIKQVDTKTGTNSNTGITTNSEITEELSTLAGSIDLNNDPELVAAVWRLYDNGITQFETVESFMPFTTLNRVWSAKMLNVFSNIFNLNSTEWITNNCIFTDIDHLDSSLQNHIKEVCQKWFFWGSNWAFNPNSEINKSHFIVALVRMLEWKHLEENVSPRRKNYYEKALQMWVISPSDAISFESPITRYEAALYLYRFKIKYQMIKNLNNSKLPNEVISTVPGSIKEESPREANVYVNSNLIKDSNFEIWYIEIFGNRYKISKTTVEQYFTNNFVWYGEVFDLASDEKVWTVSFIVSNDMVIEWSLRNWQKNKTYTIQSLTETNAHYKITETP